MLFCHYFFLSLYYERSRSDSGKNDNASTLSGGFGDGIQGRKTIV